MESDPYVLESQPNYSFSNMIKSSYKLKKDIVVQQAEPVTHASGRLGETIIKIKDNATMPSND